MKQRIKYKSILICIVLLTGYLGFAQQDPQYTQYMYNMNIVNPAYAGSKDETLALGLLARKQWVNLEGAPTTYTLSGHAPVGKKVGLGLSIINDEIGPVNETNVYSDVSYTLSLGDERFFAFGVKTGFTFHKVGLYDKIYHRVPDIDEDFAQNTSRAFFNFGAGIFYYTNHFYFAASIPNMVNSYYLNHNGVKLGTEKSHFFVTSGYVFDVNKNLKIKPFTMIKSAFGAPISIDASLNALINNKVELGLTYRLQDSFGALINFQINPSLRIGYAYDRVVSDLKIATPASHEIIILFDLPMNKKVHNSARYF